MGVLADGISLSGAGETLALVLGLVGLCASVVAYFRSSYAKATIETLKESNAALTERVEIVEGENERCSVELRSLKIENSNLRTYVSGTEAINGLQRAIHEQFTTLTGQMNDLKGLLNDRRQSS